MDDDTLPPPGPHLLDVSMFWHQAGGVRRVIGAKDAQLRARGWRHSVVAPRASGPDTVDAGGVAMPFSGGYRAVLSGRRATRAIERLHPDLIEAADPYTLAWSARKAARHLGVPVVAFCHSDMPALAARLTGGDGRASRAAAHAARAYLVRLYAGFDLVLAPSHFMTQRLRDWGVAHAVQQPLGVDTTLFQPRLRDAAWRAELMRQLELEPGTRLLVYCGRFAPEKNLPLLRDAVRRLGAGHALIVAGAGPCVLHEAHDAGRAHLRVLPTLTDRRELARLLANADCFVHAGNQETFGLAALEAMACGTPVVTSSAAGLGELVEGAGTVVDECDDRNWADAIEATLQSDDTPANVRRGLERAHAHDWRRVMDRWLRRYTRLLADATSQPRSDAASKPPARA